MTKEGRGRGQANVGGDGENVDQDDYWYTFVFALLAISNDMCLVHAVNLKLCAVVQFVLQRPGKVHMSWLRMAGNVCSSSTALATEK